MTPGYKAVYANLTMYIGIASVMLYSVLLIVYWLRNRFSGVVSQDEQQKRQKRMTKTLGISCTFTLVFFCFPHIVRVHLFALKHTPANIATVLIFASAFKNVNSLAQPILLLKRHKELRKAVSKLRCFTAFGKKVSPSVANNHALPILH